MDREMEAMSTHNLIRWISCTDYLVWYTFFFFFLHNQGDSFQLKAGAEQQPGMMPIVLLITTPTRVPCRGSFG